MDDVINKILSWLPSEYSSYTKPAWMCNFKPGNQTNKQDSLAKWNIISANQNKKCTLIALFLVRCLWVYGPYNHKQLKVYMSHTECFCCITNWSIQYCSIYWNFSMLLNDLKNEGIIRSYKIYQKLIRSLYQFTTKQIM